MRAARPLRTLAVLALAAAWARPVWADVVLEPEDPKLNYRVHLPDTTPDAWVKRPNDPALRKNGVDAVAERTLEMLSDKKTPGDGRGARVVVSVSDPPKDFPAEEFEDDVFKWQIMDAQLAQLRLLDADSEVIRKQIDELEGRMKPLEERFHKDLSSLALREDMVSLLLARFDPKPVPQVDDALHLFGGPSPGDPKVPAVPVTADGEAGNLKGNAMPCKGKMFVYVIRRKLYRIAYWAWPKNARDGDGVWRRDLMHLELTSVVPKSPALPKKPGDAGPVVPGIPGAIGGDEGEEKVLDMLMIEGWKVVKPIGMKTIVHDPAKVKRPYAFHFQTPDQGVAMLLSVMRSDERDENGLVAGEYDARRAFLGIWTNFLAAHSQGPLESFDWPPQPKLFLTLPPLEAEKRNPVKRPPPGEKKEWDWSELEKLKVVAEADRVVFNGQKARNTYRMGMRGVRERGGMEMAFYWVWTINVRTYLLHVIAYKEGALEVHKGLVDGVLKSLSIKPPE